MKCTECQNEMPKGSVFCPICGREAKEEPTLATGETPPAKKKKKWWLLAVAVVLLAAVALAMFAAQRPGIGIYTTTSGLFLSDLSGGEPVKLWEHGNYRSIVITENQKHLFFMAEKNDTWPTDLYHLDLRSLSKEPELLAEHVTQHYVNDWGTRVVYIRDDNLYVHNLKSERLVAEEVDFFICDEDMNTFVWANWVKIGDAFDLTKKWHLKDGNREPVLVGGDGLVEVLRLTADGKTLIYSVDDKLCAWKNGKETVIAENAARVSGVYEDGTFYYRTGKETDHSIYFYDGKKSVKIAEAPGVKMGPGKEPILTWQDEQSGHCYVALRDRVTEIPLEQVLEVVPSEDGNTLLVTTRGKESSSESLYTVDISRGKAEKVRLLVQDAAKFDARWVGKHVYYWVDEQGKLGTLYCDGERILEEVQDRFQVHEETGTILIRGEASSDDRSAVYMLRNGKTIKLTDAGGETVFATNGDVLVRADITGKFSEIWCFDENGKSTFLDMDVTGVYSIGSLRRPSSIILWEFD